MVLLLLRSHSGPPPHLTGETGLTLLKGRVHRLSLAPERRGLPGREEGESVSDLWLPLTSAFLKLLPVHFKVTTRPEAHPSLKWREWA